MGLAFMGIYIYTSALTFLAFFISLFIPFIGILDAPVLLPVLMGFGVGFYIAVKKSPAKIRLLILAFLFAGWIFFGFQTITYALYGSLPYSIF